MKDNVPAYLESTIDAAPRYEKKGFKAVEKPSMIIAGMSEDGASVVYSIRNGRSISPSEFKEGMIYRYRTCSQWTTRTCPNV